jgi:hypothetical protein
MMHNRCQQKCEVSQSFDTKKTGFEITSDIYLYIENSNFMSLIKLFNKYNKLSSQ